MDNPGATAPIGVPHGKRYLTRLLLVASPASGAAGAIVLLTLPDDARSMGAALFPTGVYLLALLIPRYAAAGWTFGRIVALAFPAFFGFGFLNYILSGRRIAFGIAGPVSAQLVSTVLTNCSICAVALVVGDALGTVLSPRNNPVKPASSSSAVLLWTTEILFLLAAAGSVLSVEGYGSLSAASAALTVHDRNVGLLNSSNLGSALWGIFALPAVLGLVIVALRQTPRTLRVLVIAQVTLVLTYAIVVAGSRLLVITAAAGVIVVFAKATSRQVPVLPLIVGVTLFVLVSSVVVSQRASSQNTAAPGLLETLSYSVFDVAVAATSDDQRLRDAIWSAARAGTAFSSALPGSGQRAETISASRLDVLFVQSVGTAAQAASSGLPPSLPVVLEVAGGPLVGAGAGLVLGVTAGLVTTRLRAMRSDIGVLLLALWGAFIFNVFKDGDLALDLGAELRRWVYVLLLFTAVGALGRLRHR